MSEAEMITIACSCGKTLKGPATAMGKKARCPACGAIITVSDDNIVRQTDASASKVSATRSSVAQSSTSKPAIAARQSPAVARRPEPELNDESNDEYDLAGFEKKAEPPAPAPPAATLEYQSPPVNKPTGAQPVRPLPAPMGGRFAKPAPVDMMAPQGQFVLGLAYSLGLALAASVVWIVVAYFTGVTIGYIAILVGIAAGFGMNYGQKGYSAQGGYAAAGITLVAIVVAKLITLQLYLNSRGSHRTIFDATPALLGKYLFGSPMGLIIIAVGVFAAYRAANGAVRG